MITRIVKMTFVPERVSEFLEVFDANKERIAGFEGCTHLKLLHDINDPSIFFTYSHWDSVEHLNKYRDSDLFAGVWNQTKILFAAKAEAWSVDVKFER
ncbi:MAG TPA: antibiotic biosynthesis monooxygenase family protein [Bacteroidia bacterium]